MNNQMSLRSDYDVWHDEHDAVSVEAVVANLMKNVATAKEVLRRVIPRVPASCRQGCPDALFRWRRRRKKNDQTDDDPNHGFFGGFAVGSNGLPSAVM